VVVPPPDGTASTDARSLLAVLRRNWTLLAVGCGLGLLAGLGYASAHQPSYSATSAVFVATSGAGTPQELAQGSTYTQTVVQSYAQVVTLPVVLQPVIQDLQLDTTPTALARSITVKAPTGTVVLDITVTRSSAAEAARIARAVSDQLEVVVPELSLTRTGGVVVRAVPVASATVPTVPSSTGVSRYAAVGLVAGGLIALVGAFTRDAVRSPLPDRAAVARVTGAPVVVAVPLHRRNRSEALATRTVVDRARLALRGGLRLLAEHPQGRHTTPGTQIVVTSPAGGEGVTTTAVALAGALSETGRRVLLIDANLVRPGVARTTGAVLDAPGLSSALSGAAHWQELVVPGPQRGFDLLTAGPAAPTEPGTLLNWRSVDELLTSAAQHYEAVVVDSGPVLADSSGTAVLAAATATTLLVVDARASSARAVREALVRLETAGARVVGIALNRTRSERTTYSRSGSAPTGEVRR